jgi:hypothetical protein
MKQVLYFFSKTDSGIIRNCPSSTKNIHATLGFFVLLTGIMAFFSGSYAISNMFIHENPITQQPEMNRNGWTYSFLIGVVYASFIMAIDREIVSANNKWSAVLRIPLAIIIGLVVSVPVELQIFEGKIIKQLKNERNQEMESLRGKLENELRIPVLDADKRRIEDLRQEAIKKRDYWADAMEAEVVGRVRSGRTGKSGKGDAYDEAVLNMNLQNGMIKKYDDELVAKGNELKEANRRKETDFEKQRADQSYDLLSKYIALKQVKKNDKTGSAARMGLGITILFCLFELIPSLMKLLTPQTEYDVLLDKRTRLNINAVNLIYQKVYFEYNGMTVDEIMDQNPTVITKMYETLAK